jgi:hypothetical protein
MKATSGWLQWTTAVFAAAAVASLGAQNGTPPASAAKAKEVAALMTAKKLETFAARDGDKPGKYVAVLLVPNVQLLVVSASYFRDNDIEYALYHKQYNNAYLDLRAGVFGSERFFVDDAQADGLVALPGKNPQHDTIALDKTRTVFDGLFGDGKGRNAKKPLTEDYMKAFSDADARYARILDVLLAQLKAGGELAGSAAMR